MEASETRHTTSGDVHIAYQVFGEGRLHALVRRQLERFRGTEVGVPETWRLFEVTAS